MLNNVKISNLVLAILIILWSFSISVFILLHFTELYIITIKWVDISINVNLTELNKNFNYISEYLQSPFIHTMHNLIAVDHSGREHFREVKQLILMNNISMIILTFFLTKKLYKLKQDRCLWVIMNELKIVYVSLMVICIFGLLDFNDLFILFHRILFFSTSNWIFNVKTNPIINVFPEEYFMICFVFVYICITIVVGFLFYLGKKDLNK